MKKILTAALAVIVTALALTGCDNGNTPGYSNSSAITSSGSAPSDTVTSSEGGNSDTVTAGKAKELVDRATAFEPDEWSAMMDYVTDPEYLAALLPGIDTSICEDYCFKIDQAGISKHSVLVAKAKAGSEDALKTMFENYLNSLKGPDAFLYPAGEESVNGSVIDVTSDGYNYIILHANGAAIADAMIN